MSAASESGNGVLPHHAEETYDPVAGLNRVPGVWSGFSEEEEWLLGTGTPETSVLGTSSPGTRRRRTAATGGTSGRGEAAASTESSAGHAGDRTALNRARRRVALKHHPDKAEPHNKVWAHENWLKIDAAYVVLLSRVM